MKEIAKITEAKSDVASVGYRAGVGHCRDSGSLQVTAAATGSLRELPGKSSLIRALGRWFDGYFGKGRYHWLRERLDPHIQHSQLVYAELLKQTVTFETRWLDAGCGHQILEARLHKDEIALVERSGWPRVAMSWRNRPSGTEVCATGW